MGRAKRDRAAVAQPKDDSTLAGQASKKRSKGTAAGKRAEAKRVPPPPPSVSEVPLARGETVGFSAVSGLSESIRVSKQPHDFGNGTSAYLYYREDGTEADVEGSDVQPLSALHQGALAKMLRESTGNPVENFRRYYAACVGASGVKTAPGSHVIVDGVRYYATYVFNHGECPTVEALRLTVLLCDYAASGSGAAQDEAASMTMQGLMAMMDLSADQLPQMLNFVSWCAEGTPFDAEFALGASIMKPFLAFLKPTVVTVCGTGDTAKCAARAIDGFPEHKHKNRLSGCSNRSAATARLRWYLGTLRGSDSCSSARCRKPLSPACFCTRPATAPSLLLCWSAGWITRGHHQQVPS